jgi:hypothetical protein
LYVLEESDSSIFAQVVNKKIRITGKDNPSMLAQIFGTVQISFTRYNFCDVLILAGA